jgi:hypothetical protein
MRLRRHLPWVLTLLGTLSAACGRSRLDAPFPEVRADLPDLPDLPASYLAAPLVLELGPIIEAMEREVPTTLGDIEERLDHPSNDRMHLAFEVERSPLTASLNGSTARIRSTLRYRGRGWYNPPLLPEVSASCGTSDSEDDRPRAQLSISSPLSLAPDWTLVSRARIDSIRPASGEVRDTCSLTVLGIDVTERVMTAAEGQIGGRMRTLDRLVAGVDLRSKIEGVWRTLREPISLADGVWLFLDPREIYLRSLQGLGLTLQAEVGLLAFPRVVLGQRPVADSIALPDLQRTDLPSGLRILIEGEADYDASAALLTRELGGLGSHIGRTTSPALPTRKIAAKPTVVVAKSSLSEDFVIGSSKTCQRFALRR